MQSKNPQRIIRVRAIRRDPPNLKLLAKTLVELATYLNEKEAKAGKRKTPPTA